MAEHAWTVLCSKIIVDADSGHVTAMEAADRLIVNDTPEGYAKALEKSVELGKELILPVEYSYFSQWFRTDRDVPEPPIELRVSVTSPAGEKKVRSTQIADFREYPAVRLLLRFDRLILRGFGIYHFELEKKEGDDWISVSRYPLHVLFRDLVATASTNEPSQPSAPTPPAASLSDSRPAPSRPSRRRASPKPQRRRS